MVRKNKILVNERNQKLQTPLHVAIDNGNVKLALFLLESGADINTRDLKGNSCY